MTHPRQVLFLCTGNSCRSQMAEAIVNTRRGEQWHAVSAGTQPAEHVHPLALRALAEIGITHPDAVPKSAEAFRDAPLDMVITVCDDAAENCPIWLGQGKKLHVSFPDPAKATGTDEEIMAVFRAVREDIERRVLTVLDTL
ncbi:MAG TPA: arsenate reductase ArsC [Aggregatilinea sp.]|uniref:arsenate reductase ArsC n=1 Tax=Aggregatilinea sp. TaxID=2806333 RepID=UPI002BD5F21A|nr:arsenate reductase ArsC [Aggregatilinea sp.]HML21401.1 arsenate reductase ArsC [Aggregatilinea sp.]